MQFKTPTPDRVYMKILSEFAKNKNGEWYSDISVRLFHKKGYQNMDLFKALVSNGYLELHHKERNKKLYSITEAGNKILEFSMQFSDVIKFADVACACPSYPEFMLEIVCQGCAELGTLDFYKKMIAPLREGIMPPGLHYSQYVDIPKVVTHLKNKINLIPWISDYIEAKCTELQAEVSNNT